MSQVIITPAAFELACKIIHGYEGLGGQKGNLFYPYHCTADAPGLMTLGKGRLLSAAELANGMTIGGQHVDVNKGITYAQVVQLFFDTCEPRKERLSKLLRPDAPDREVAALFSLFYNNEKSCGPTGTPGKLHRANNPNAAALSFFLYKMSGEPLRPMEGLWRRRATEALCYLTGEIIFGNKGAAEEKLLYRRLYDLGVRPARPAKLY